MYSKDIVFIYDGLCACIYCIHCIWPSWSTARATNEIVCTCMHHLDNSARRVACIGMEYGVRERGIEREREKAFIVYRSVRCYEDGIFSVKWDKWHSNVLAAKHQCIESIAVALQYGALHWLYVLWMLCNIWYVVHMDGVCAPYIAQYSGHIDKLYNRINTWTPTTLSQCVFNFN